MLCNNPPLSALPAGDMPPELTGLDGVLDADGAGGGGGGGGAAGPGGGGGGAPGPGGGGVAGPCGGGGLVSIGPDAAGGFEDFFEV